MSRGFPLDDLNKSLEELQQSLKNASESLGSNDPQLDGSIQDAAQAARKLGNKAKSK